MFVLRAPYPEYLDLRGNALDDGSLYFGTVGLNPRSNPIIVYWDQAGTLQAAQPITTVNGYPSRDGTAADVFIPTDYSIAIYDKKGNLVTYKSSSTDAVTPNSAINSAVRQASSTGVDTATSSDGLIYWATAFTGTKTQFIPSASAVTPNFRLIIKDLLGDANLNNIAITPATGTIDNAVNYLISQGGKISIEIAADPVNNRWLLV